MQSLLRRPGVLVAIAAIVASIASIANDFVYDDRAMLVDVVRLHGLGEWRDILTQPFWPPPFYDLLYRPVTSFSLAFQYTLGAGSPVVFRVVSIALYAIGARLFFSLAARLISRNAALAAAVLWAVHPVHVEAVAQAVNQAELVVGIIALLMVTRYYDARRAGALSMREWGVQALLFAVAALCKESGFILPALLAIVEVFLIPGEAAAAPIRKLWSGYALLAVTAITLFALRAQVLAGSVLTANPSTALAGATLGHRMLAMLQVVPMWLRLLVFPLRLQVDFTPAELGMPDHFGVPEAAGVALVLSTAAAIVAMRRKAPVLAFGLAWCVIALMPVSNIVPVYFLLAERTLFLPSIGFFIAVGAAGQWVATRGSWPWRRQALVVACGVACVLGIIRSTSRHLVWNSAHIHIKGSQPARSNRTMRTVPNWERVVVVQPVTVAFNADSKRV